MIIKFYAIAAILIVAISVFAFFTLKAIKRSAATKLRTALFLEISLLSSRLDSIREQGIILYNAMSTKNSKELYEADLLLLKITSYLSKVDLLIELNSISSLSAAKSICLECLRDRGSFNSEYTSYSNKLRHLLDNITTSIDSIAEQAKQGRIAA
jgi:hypothetical protein